MAKTTEPENGKPAKGNAAEAKAEKERRFQVLQRFANRETYENRVVPDVAWLVRMVEELKAKVAKQMDINKELRKDLLHLRRMLTRQRDLGKEAEAELTRLKKLVFGKAFIKKVMLKSNFAPGVLSLQKAIEEALEKET